MKSKSNALQYYPLAVKLSDGVALVVGGGKVAERKIATLRDCRARIRMVSPGATDLLRRLAKMGKIEWVRRHLRDSDVRGARIVVAATDDRDVNERVSRLARKHRVWVNVVDKPILSDFISPALFRTKKSIVTVYTDGRDPVLSRDLKNFLKERWDDFLSYRDRL
ncbi:MAG: bifunctional precorrin-2 dehydrogenase/sirohydrochlorin ferrochelatase [Candidatus Omnitrophica bacterium]|nr:bifunctional precorrin-2 dehydrogenase/sirohydrochlorin ferrochelatase [Candidatus Omnitrophota bacterium]